MFTKKWVTKRVISEAISTSPTAFGKNIEKKDLYSDKNNQ